MPIEVCLRLAGTFAGYFLQVAAAYAACALLARLSVSPQARFRIWFAFVAAAGTYWVCSLATVRGASGGAVASGLEILPARGLSLPGGWERGFALCMTAAAVGYVSIASLLLARLGLRHLRLGLVLPRRIEPSPELLARFLQMSRRVGMSSCELAILPGFASPATTGIWRRRILLPLECDTAEVDVEDVLRHELAHVVRRDYLWATITDLIGCVLFFHPLVNRACRSLQLEREVACDLDVVRDRPERRADYAECLTRFARARMLSEGPVLGIDFAAGSILTMRVETILAAPRRQPRWSAAVRASAALAVLAACGTVLPAMTVVLRFAPSVIADEPATTALAPAVTQRTSHVHVGRKAVAAGDAPAADGHPAVHRWSARLPVGSDSLDGPIGASRPAEDASAAPVRTSEPGRSLPQAKGPGLGDVVAATVGAIATGADRDDRHRAHLVSPAGRQP